MEGKKYMDEKSEGAFEIASWAMDTTSKALPNATLVMYGLHHSEKYEDEGLAAMSAQLYGL
jgi:hypothetical protein